MSSKKNRSIAPITKHSAPGLHPATGADILPPASCNTIPLYFNSTAPWANKNG
jgi:hypothetical protein